MMLLDETLQWYVRVSYHALIRTRHTIIHIIARSTVNRTKSHLIRTNFIVMNKVISSSLLSTELSLKYIDNTQQHRCALLFVSLIFFSSTLISSAPFHSNMLYKILPCS